MADSGLFLGLLLSFRFLERFPRLTNLGLRLRVGYQHSQFWLFWSISWTITRRFGVPDRFSKFKIPGVPLRVRRQHSQFWPIQTRFLDYYSPFWGPEAISIVVEPQGAYMPVINTRGFGQFWSVSWNFSLFWGPRVISTIHEPRGAFTCRSSTLEVFVDSDLLRGLLLTVLGSQSNFQGC